MTSDEEFRESLEMGVQAENIAYSYLIRKYSYVQDLRQQKHGEFSGPCLRGTEGRLVLPDFSVYTKFDGAFAIDVKAKNSLYSFKGLNCFTVDSKFNDYRRAVQILKLDYLAFIFFYKDRMHLYRDSDCIGSQILSNSYGTGPVYYFEYDKKRIIY